MLILVLTFSLAAQKPVWADDGVAHSVVKILVTQDLPDVFKPWTKQSPREISGSGVVIEGKRILTNAHVVAFASQIYVQPYQSAEKIAARVVGSAPGIDLALLELTDESFFQRYPSLSFAAKLPKVKDTVNVYGYPMGGQEQSVTSGIVSRIEYTSMHYNVSCLQIQIDAALNPGNSGGPAVSNGKMIGLVCSKIKTAENIGYLITMEEIKMFLDDLADGSYGGQPTIHGVHFQTVENDALRSRLKLAKGSNGLMLTSTQNSGADFPLRPWDLITHVGEYAIDNEGHVHVHDGLRLPALYLVPRLANKGKIEVTVIRDGKIQKLQVPVSVEAEKLIPFKGHVYPPYFIYGPLVFTSATEQLVRSLGQNQQAIFYLMLNGSPIITRLTDFVAFKGEELVAVVAPMFPHKITKGYDQKVLGVVRYVNDVRIKNLVHLVETLRDAKDEHIIFRFAGSADEILVFRRKEVEAATEDILTNYGIRRQCSQDLRSIWEKTSGK